MNLKNIATKDLCQELLNRATHTDALLALVNGAGNYHKPEAKEPRRSPSGHRKLITQADVIECIRSAGKQLDAATIKRRLRSRSPSAVNAHLFVMFRAGKLIRMGVQRPYSYTLPGNEK